MARVEKSQRDFDNLTYVAWQTAELSRRQKLPDLKTLISKRSQLLQKPQSGDEAFGIILMHHAVLGGKLPGKKG